MATLSQVKVFRFSVFELDFSTGEFRKKRVRIRLQQQPLQVLVALLERPGELVTRDELKRRLWPDDTFVDFNHSLNAAVNRLREVLSDSADTPRFVETLPRRGYRFIAPVTVDGVLPPRVEPAEPGRLLWPTLMGRRGGWIVAAVGLVLFLGLGATFGSYLFGPSARLRQLNLQAVPLTTSEGEERSPSFSPDGTQVAFAWNGKDRAGYDIYVKMIGSPDELRLTDDPVSEIRPAWSPDGRRIAYIRWTAAAQTIYLVGPLGGSKRKVAEFSNLADSSLAWWPDSKSLVISERETGQGKLKLFRLFVDSGDKQRLTDPLVPAHEDRLPAISPDGKTLAFVRGNSAKEQIYLLPLKGGEPRRLTADSGPMYGLTWTTDSQGIVYSHAQVDGRLPSLWRISTAGGEPEELATLGQRVYNPSISRQGGKFVFERGLEDSNLWRYELARGGKPPGPTEIVYSTHIDAAPQISPDGRRIVFASTRTGNCDLWICDRDGSNQQQLTFMGEAHAGSSRWSPDNRQIAFDASPGGTRDIFVVSPGGGSPRRLTDYPGEDSRPSYSRDGKWIYFNSARSGDFQIWKIPAAGGEAVQVTKAGGFQPFESPDGRYLYFARGQQESSIWRVPLTGGEPGQEEMVLGLPLAGDTANWDIAAAGLYFVQCAPGSNHGACTLRLLRSDTGKEEKVLDLLDPPFGATPLHVSPDGKWLIYTQHDEWGSDLMLVDDFQ